MKFLTSVFLFLISFSVLAAQSINPGFIRIDNPAEYKRVLAISDVHGMYNNMLTNLYHSEVIDQNLNWIAGKSLLVIVGDSINKGPDSLKILDFWIHLSHDAYKKGGVVIHLLGNHEAELLADPHGIGFNQEMASDLRDRNMTYEELISPMGKYGSYLRSMPGFLILGKWLFSHAGYVPEENFQMFANRMTEALRNGDYRNDLIIGDNSILQQKDWWEKDATENLDRLTATGLYGVVFGHKPKAFKAEGRIEIRKGRMIKIDTGMAPGAGEHTGEILIFTNPRHLNLAEPMTDVYAQGNGQYRRLQ